MRARSGEARCDAMRDTRFCEASLNSMNDKERSRTRDSASGILGVSDHERQSS
jgi:hypothetical protein